MSCDRDQQPSTVMNRTLSTSVCMATYNGAKFLRQQLESIKTQTDPVDEVVIVDDASCDDTREIIRSFQGLKIRLIENVANLGVVRSFEIAIASASGELIFLCDQDDVWREDKIASFKELFLADAGVTVALSDALVIDGQGATLRDSWMGASGFDPSLFRNLVRNRYLGCVMVIARENLKYCLPFPSHLPMHDMWVGMVNQMFGKVAFIPEPLVSYRRHEGTVTKGHHASIRQMVLWRYHLVLSLATRAMKCYLMRR